jgi:hypothetical protein
MYIAYDVTQIYGLGETADAAIADALFAVPELTGLLAGECTDALAAQVDAEGGAIAWGENADGIFCTIEEENDARL